MLGKIFRVSAVAVAACALANVALPALADGGMGDVFEQSILPGANTALKNVMSQTPPPKSDTNVAQAPPVSPL